MEFLVVPRLKQLGAIRGPRTTNGRYHWGQLQLSEWADWFRMKRMTTEKSLSVNTGCSFSKTTISVWRFTDSSHSWHLCGDLRGWGGGDNSRENPLVVVFKCNFSLQKTDCGRLLEWPRKHLQGTFTDKEFASHANSTQARTRSGIWQVFLLWADSFNFHNTGEGNSFC